jgi:hypothetical protein
MRFSIRDSLPFEDGLRAIELGMHHNDSQCAYLTSLIA